MSDDASVHPLLEVQLQSLELSRDTPPSLEDWSEFLDTIDGSYEEEHKNALVLDRSFDTMIRHAVDAFLIHDTRGKIIDFNQAACEMLGYSRAELLSMEVADFELELNPGAIWDGMTADEVFTVEGVHQRKDGSTYPAETRVGAFMADGQKVILALCRDITERKQAEQDLQQLNRQLAGARDAAVKASRTKSTFLANMSHELRTPLNAIIGYSEFLIEEMEDNGDQSYVADQRRIKTAGHQLLSLIDDILDLSKIEAGKVELEIIEFDVGEMIEDIEATIKPLAKKNNNRFIVDVVGNHNLHSDVTKLRQILLNLISNACKFTSDGQIRLRVEPGSDEDTLRFSVADTGVGMTHEELAVIFDAFQQADASTTRKFGGTGLGLAITRHFCRLLNATMEVESTPGQGTTFSFTMPVDISDISG